MTEQNDAHTQIYAGGLLNAMARNVSVELSSFCSWFIAGAAAFLAVVLSGVDKLGPYLDLSNLPFALRLFIAAVACNVIQRWLGAMVGGSVAVVDEIQKINVDESTDLLAALSLVKSASYLPFRFAFRSAEKALEREDFIYSPRLNARLSQIQSLLVFPQFGFLLWTALTLLP